MSPVVPTRSPADVKASRSQDDLSITVTWASSTFEDVGAFFIYKITATPGSSNRRRRQAANPVVQYEPYNETSTVITGLDPREGYSVTVTYVIFGQNGDVTGPDSNPIQVPPSKLKTDIMKCNLEHVNQLTSIFLYFQKIHLFHHHHHHQQLQDLQPLLQCLLLLLPSQVPVALV